MKANESFRQKIANFERFLDLKSIKFSFLDLDYRLGN